MKKLLFAFLLSIMATSVHADGNGIPFIDCGVKFASENVSYQPSSYNAFQRFNVKDRVVRSIEADPTASTTSIRVKNSSVRTRLPSQITLAKFECSFR